MTTSKFICALSALDLIVCNRSRKKFRDPHTNFEICAKPCLGTTRGARLEVKYAWEHPEKKTIDYESEKLASKKLSDTWDKRRSRYIQGYSKINERNTTTWRETDPDPSETLENNNYQQKTNKDIPSPK